MAVLARESYRDAMARLTGAVNIVSSDGPAGLGGLTATAVCSVTDEPPTLLACVNLSSRQSELLRTNGVLCVNTLAAGQEAVARAFSTRDLDIPQRFATGSWSTLATGAPVLQGAMAVFDCRVVERLERGAHAVLFCEVLAAHAGEGAPLVYFDRAFRRLETP
jgi:flavin reductase